MRRRLEAWLLLAAAALPAAAQDASTFRHRAPIEVQRAGAFVEVPLTPAAYARSMQPGLADLRVVDADGARVPFALLAPRGGESRVRERMAPAALYALPKRPGADWQAPVEVHVDGDRLSVTRRAGTPAPAQSAGWLVDLGERRAGQAAPSAIRLQWSGPADFSVAYDLDHSEDLRTWRRGPGGHLLALSSPAGPLTQPTVPLPEGTGRFVRLVWAEAGSAPLLTGAQGVVAERQHAAGDAPTTLTLRPVAAADRALHVDLGAVLPLVALDLRLPAGTRVAPMRIQARDTPTAPWRELASTVFYRIERDGQPSVAPALSLQATARELRLVPDERAGVLDPAQTRVVVQVQLARLVVAAQGRPPWTLMAGSSDASPGALPVSTLVPQLDAERSRFGEGSLGAWTESPEAARAMRQREQMAAWRPVLLWGVLVLGVAGLGWMVWRLGRGDRKG